MQLLAGAKVIEVGNSSKDRTLFNGMVRTKWECRGERRQLSQSHHQGDQGEDDD